MIKERSVSAEDFALLKKGESIAVDDQFADKLGIACGDVKHLRVGSSTHVVCVQFFQHAIEEEPTAEWHWVATRYVPLGERLWSFVLRSFSRRQLSHSQ